MADLFHPTSDTETPGSNHVYDDGGIAARPEHSDPSTVAKDLKASEENPIDAEQATNSSSKSLNSTELANAEQGPSLYRPEGKPRKFLARARKRTSGLLKNKLALALVGAGGVSVVGIILLIVFLLGLLKIPNLAANIATYEFARITRDYARNSDNITAEKMAVSAADDSVYGKIKAQYTETTGKVSDTWGKLDKYQPQKVVDNLKTSGDLSFEYKSGRFGRQILTGVKIGDNIVPVKPTTFASRVVPGIKFANDITFSRDFAPALRQAMLSNDIGPIVRGQVARTIRQGLGISLVAWDVGKFQGKTPAQAEVVIEQESYSKIKTGAGATNPNVSDSLNSTAEEANAAERSLVDNAIALEKFDEAPNQLPTEVTSVVEKSLNAGAMSSAQSAIKTAVGVVNPIYAVAVPLCIVYDGSLVQSGPTINSQSDQLERTGIWVMSAADQQKQGTNASATAVGAANWKVGDITDSIPQRRAEGLPVDTSSYQSVQASPTGSFSIADAIFPAPLNAIMDKAAGSCKTITNIWVGVGLGVANIALALGTGGISGVSEGGAEGAADVAVQSLTQRIVAKFVIAKTLTKTFIKDGITQGAAIAGATFLAKIIVLSQMGGTHSPLATGASFANDADAGLNIHAQKLERQLVYGAPLAASDIAYNNMSDKQFIASNMQTKSAFERYLSPSEPNSLISHTALEVQTQVHGSWLSSLLSAAATIFNPLHGQTFLNLLMPAKAQALAASDTYNYGQVQWGWSAQEQALINSTSPDNTYNKSLANQLVLDQSGKEDEIASKYGPCYDPSKQAGDLLTTETGAGGNDKYYIVRDTQGNVIPDQGLCSPKNLGPTNPTYGDLVFRWRLAQGYNQLLDDKADIQNPTQSDTPVTAATSATPATTTSSPATINYGDTSNLTCDAGSDAGVADGYRNGNLVKIRVCAVQGTVVNAQIAVNIDHLLTAAKGIGLTAGSGFRTQSEQITLYDCFLSGNCNNGNPAAKPGYSNHQMGLAVDFHCNGPTVVHGDACFNWLSQHASQYGLKNLPIEAWHWSVDGT